MTAAAGAVGSAVGQIAKIKGCRVVGEDWTSLSLSDAVPFQCALTPLSRICRQRCQGGLPEEPGV